MTDKELPEKHQQAYLINEIYTVLPAIVFLWAEREAACPFCGCDPYPDETPIHELDCVVPKTENLLLQIYTNAENFCPFCFCAATLHTEDCVIVLVNSIRENFPSTK